MLNLLKDLKKETCFLKITLEGEKRVVLVTNDITSTHPKVPLVCGKCIPHLLYCCLGAYDVWNVVLINWISFVNSWYRKKKSSKKGPRTVLSNLLLTSYAECRVLIFFKTNTSNKSWELWESVIIHSAGNVLEKPALQYILRLQMVEKEMILL